MWLFMCRLMDVTDTHMCIVLYSLNLTQLVSFKVQLLTGCITVTCWVTFLHTEQVFKIFPKSQTDYLYVGHSDLISG